jgi:hypothetical protein
MVLSIDAYLSRDASGDDNDFNPVKGFVQFICSVTFDL